MESHLAQQAGRALPVRPKSALILEGGLRVRGEARGQGRHHETDWSWALTHRIKRTFHSFVLGPAPSPV